MEWTNFNAWVLIRASRCQHTASKSVTDSKIREYLHRKILRRHHSADDTLIVNELGLKYGSCRADIAVINGRLKGYEIKSDKDSLYRLKRQIGVYNAVFDSITIVVGPRHGPKIRHRIPRHWGILIATAGNRGAINFEVRRKPRVNNRVQAYSVAQLLWKKEAVALLNAIGVSRGILRLSRTELCRLLARNMPIRMLKQSVRERLRQRPDWPDQRQSFRYDDSSQPNAT